MTSSNNSNATGGEEILVLYGSQTGNSEGAAEQITALIPTKLKSIMAKEALESASDIDAMMAATAPCTARCMQLDDFLEVHHAKWTRLVVIVCSSYGVGQAPMGARKFRDVCDAILDKKQQNKDNKFLEGITFALLGLGDSHYTTFFKNPTTIDKALTAAGARRIGELGKADASGTEDMEQSKVIERWIDGIWDDLNKDISAASSKSGKKGEEDLVEKATNQTWELCLELFPEWKPKQSYTALIGTFLLIALGGVILSMLVHYYLEPGEWKKQF